QRVYAIGDIHGRRDLFEALIGAIDADDASLPPAETTVILLGDLVDRGSDSAGVIALAREWQKRRRVRILAGNHEEMFLRSFSKLEVFRHFLRHGGRETVLSYGVGRDAFIQASLEEAQQLMIAAVPAADIAFLESFADKCESVADRFGHAAMDATVPMEAPRTQDLRRIRAPFLSQPDSYGNVIVHGHPICDAPEDRGNRIGIDTGAYMSGCLTAIALEG